MAKKHYRTARKKVEQAPSKGTFVQNKDKKKYLAIAVGIMIFVFLKGLLLGFLAGRQD